MDVLPLHFQTFLYLGLWRESDEQHWLVEYIWRPFVIFVILLSTIWLLVATSISRRHVQELTECMFISLTYLSLCFKLLNFMCRRDAMNRLLNEFRVEICRPRNLEETKITAKYEKTISLIFYSYMGIAQLTGLAFLSLPLISMVNGDDDIGFLDKIYRVCCEKSKICYSLMYVLQVLGVVIGILANVASDAMLPGLVLLACCQIDLCCHRFVSSNDKARVKQCVVHQILIWRLVRNLESFFTRIALPIVLFALITLCTSIYNLSKTQIGEPESITFFMYLWSILVQLLCYCWFGNELKLKNTALREAIYSSDWTMLKPLDRRSLYFIMLSCQKERGMSLQGFGTISLDIYVWVLKTSYAAYNLLKKVETR